MQNIVLFVDLKYNENKYNYYKHYMYIMFVMTVVYIFMLCI